MTKSSEDEWRTALGNLNTWKRGNQRAVHKPLLSLMLLARAEAGGDSSVRFEEIYEQLHCLLHDFGPRRKSLHPEYPFWHLQSDGFWHVEEAEALPLRKAGNSPTKSTLLKMDAAGFVPDELWRVLAEDARLRLELTNLVLKQFWPETQHGKIKQAVGLPDGYIPTTGTETSKKLKRDPEFRKAVLRAYEHRCAVCGYDGRLGTSDLALEAAHVQWHAYKGPDKVENALAMCSFHHDALDAGALGISEDNKVLVSADVHGGDMVKQLLVRFNARRFREPQSGFNRPALSYVKWHWREVFKKPQRGASSVQGKQAR